MFTWFSRRFWSMDFSETTAMVDITEGEFTMGALVTDQEACSVELPRHRVIISKPFAIGKYPITQSVWAKIMGRNPSFFDGPDNPVEMVSWFDCVVFCNKLSQIEGRVPYYKIPHEVEVLIHQSSEINPELSRSILEKSTINPNSDGYRLPLEKEWEFAARATKEMPARMVQSSQGLKIQLQGGVFTGQYHLYAGSDNINAVAWYDQNSDGTTKKVGQKKANQHELYDLCGNVWEWCSNNFQYYGVGHKNNLKSPDKILKGGGFNTTARDTRLSFRAARCPTYQSKSVGLRVCRSLL